MTVSRVMCVLDLAIANNNEYWHDLSGMPLVQPAPSTPSPIISVVPKFIENCPVHQIQFTTLFVIVSYIVAVASFLSLLYAYILTNNL